MILAHDVAGAGPLLVLLHGITENRHTWDPVDLTGRSTVLRVDLRGHGESERVGPYDLDTLADDVAETVAAVAGSEVPLLVGHSMGAVVAHAYALRHPARAVVNVDQPLMLVHAQEGFQAMEPALTSEAFAPTMEALMGQHAGALAPEEAARVAALRRPDAEVVLGMWDAVLHSTPWQLGRLVDRLTAFPAGVPYLMVCGTDLGPAHTAWMRERMPTAQVETWSDPPTHYPHLAAPGRFVARVRALEHEVEASARL
ncbi:alpha/beta fold hydrolase [Pseudokineococcus sp. 1T1Z-3]